MAQRYYPVTVAGFGQAYGDCSRWLASWFEPWAVIQGFWDTCQDLRRGPLPSTPAQLPRVLVDQGH